MIAVARQIPEAGIAQPMLGNILDAVNRTEQSLEEAFAVFLRFQVQMFKAALPEAALRSLFAAAEKGPAQPALVVLSARQGQRHQDDVALVRQLAGSFRQFGRPIGIIDQLCLRDAVLDLTAAQISHRSDQAASQHLQTGLQLERFLILGDGPAVFVVVEPRIDAHRAVGFRSQIRRRHKFGIGLDGEGVLRSKPRRTGQQPFPTGARHGTLSFDSRLRLSVHAKPQAALGGNPHDPSDRSRRYAGPGTAGRRHRFFQTARGRGAEGSSRRVSRVQP